MALLNFDVIQGMVIGICICIWLYTFKKQSEHAFAVLHFRTTSFKINLELFEKYQTIEECIRCNEKV